MIYVWLSEIFIEKKNHFSFTEFFNLERANIPPENKLAIVQNAPPFLSQSINRARKSKLPRFLLIRINIPFFLRVEEF